MDLQMALADFRIRLLKISKWATFESLKEWYKRYLEAQMREGQDNAKGWMERREELAPLLRKRMQVQGF